MARRTKHEYLVEGAHVLLRMGINDVAGVIIEDRGPIGVNGRRLYRVRITLGDTLQELEVPAEELRPAA